MFAVRMSGISKRYGSVQALDSVDLAVEKGTMHALVGENGAGKTTLMRALYGAMSPDSGQIEIDETAVVFHQSKDAIASRIGMVSQHYGIIGELTNLENLILGVEPGVLKQDQLVEEAEELANSMGFKFDWSQESADLSPAGAQKLEILKLLWRKSEVMILDEPTAMLSPEDADSLFSSLVSLVERGKTVIIVTHRLPEVFGYCKTVTVLRAGKRVGDYTVADITTSQLAEAIVGGSVIERPAPKTNQKGEVGLEISDLSARNTKGGLAASGVNLSVNKGVILGIAGVDGSGQRELFHSILGVAAPTSGSIRFEGKDWTGVCTSNRYSDGLRLIPEDRHEEGVIGEWSLTENSVLGLQRIGEFQNLTAAQARLTPLIAQMFATKHGGYGSEMDGLSGGNQQRFVAGRALIHAPKLVLAFQPARGLDLNSTTRVYQGLRKACDDGAIAIVVSFDLDELLDFCDEIVVICNGKLSRPSPELARDRAAIGRLMVEA